MTIRLAAFAALSLSLLTAGFAQAETIPSGRYACQQNSTAPFATVLDVQNGNFAIHDVYDGTPAFYGHVRHEEGNQLLLDGTLFTSGEWNKAGGERQDYIEIATASVESMSSYKTEIKLEVIAGGILDRKTYYCTSRLEKFKGPVAPVQDVEHF